MRTLIRRILAGVLALAVLLVISLALPVEAWRRGEPAGPPLEVTRNPPQWPRPLRLWIDTDAACGFSSRTDPDDCFALLLLAHSREVEIVGISTIFGNAPLEVTDSVTRVLASRLSASGGADVAVVRGAPDPMGESIASSSDGAVAHGALARALEQESLVILALGPLTNIATVLRGRPYLQSKVMQLVAVMGRRHGHLFHPVEGGTAPSVLGHGPVFRDFNFVKDPEAAIALLDMQLPLTLVPYEAAREVQVAARHLTRMTVAGGAAAWVAARARGWLNYWEREIGRDGFYPFDLVAAGYLVRPDLFGCARASAWIGKDAGILGWLGRSGLFVRPRQERISRESAAAPSLYCPELMNDAGAWILSQLLSTERSGMLHAP